MQLQRPLSPHLTVYRPQRGSVLSISMRISGVLLCIPFFFLGLAPLLVSCGWASASTLVLSSLDPLMWCAEGVRSLTSLQGVEGISPVHTLGFFCASLCILATWALVAYHCINPTVDFLMEEWSINTAYSYTQEYWKTHYMVVVGLFTFAVGLGLGVWWDFLLELSDAYADYAECHLHDDLGPAFDRTLS